MLVSKRPILTDDDSYTLTIALMWPSITHRQGRCLCRLIMVEHPQSSGGGEEEGGRWLPHKQERGGLGLHGRSTLA